MKGRRAELALHDTKALVSQGMSFGNDERLSSQGNRRILCQRIAPRQIECGEGEASRVEVGNESVAVAHALTIDRAFELVLGGECVLTARNLRAGEKIVQSRSRVSGGGIVRARTASEKTHDSRKKTP